MEIKESTEIRKVSLKHRSELARILEDLDKWMDIMAIIPQRLSKNIYKCRISTDNPPKYNSEHFRLVQSGSKTTGKCCSEILFEEWGCSGCVRPTLGHLLFLLKEAQLYRAADYVCDILNKARPERPTEGPPAIINMTPSEVIKIRSEPYIPQIVISETKTDNYSPSSSIISNQSTEEISNDVPLIPALSQLLDNSNSILRTDSNISTETITEDLSISQGVMPQLSDLLRSESKSSIKESNILPNISILMAQQSSSDENNFQTPSKLSDGNLRHCSSPLPNLWLNTDLPSFQYVELEKATDNFDETPYTPGSNNGKFLGSGAFGSVYLGLGLLDRPVAVKKINLKDLNIVTADAFITKQFKNEVEIIYKYKHDNLLSLLGYSCDGLTYCLLYEYISGGNLKDRLEKGNELIWTDRLHIALGTARGVTYLHTAYSAPLVHRDIKSANILLDATNKPKLCDFGIVRLSSPTTTGTSQIFGTSAYMPPEAHRGDVSVKLDTFSFGVVLLELLTGLPPMDDNRTGHDLVTHVQDSLTDEDDITPLLDVRAGSWFVNETNFANELYKISVKCLQDKKSARPTMLQVTEELDLIDLL